MPNLLFACFLLVVLTAGCEPKQGALTERSGKSVLVGAAASAAPLLREHFAQNVAMNAGVKLRKAALEALPEALREEARQPDLTPFPVLRRVFTETAPIPGFQAEVRRTDRG